MQTMWAFDSFALGLRLLCLNWSAFFVLSHTSQRILEPSLLHLLHSFSSWWKLRKSLYSPHDRQMLHCLQRGHITRLFRPGFGAKSVWTELDLQIMHCTICSDWECENITSTKKNDTPKAGDQSLDPKWLGFRHFRLEPHPLQQPCYINECNILVASAVA